MLTKTETCLRNRFYENEKAVNEKETVWYVSIIPYKQAQALGQPEDFPGIAEGSPLRIRVCLSFSKKKIFAVCCGVNQEQVTLLHPRSP